MFSLRTLAFVAAVWLLAAWYATQNLTVGKPPLQLSRASAGLPELATAAELPTDRAIAINEQSRIWGVERDGRPIQRAASAPQASASAPWIQWYLLAAAVRANERYIVIRTSAGSPIRIAEGETLPDGSKLVRVGRDDVQIKPIKGALKTFPLYAK